MFLLQFVLLCKEIKKISPIIDNVKMFTRGINLM